MKSDTWILTLLVACLLLGGIVMARTIAYQPNIETDRHFQTRLG